MGHQFLHEGQHLLNATASGLAKTKETAKGAAAKAAKATRETAKEKAAAAAKAMHTANAVLSHAACESFSHAAHTMGAERGGGGGRGGAVGTVGAAGGAERGGGGGRGGTVGTAGATGGVGAALDPSNCAAAQHGARVAPRGVAWREGGDWRDNELAA